MTKAVERFVSTIREARSNGVPLASVMCVTAGGRSIEIFFAGVKAALTPAEAREAAAEVEEVSSGLSRDLHRMADEADDLQRMAAGRKKDKR